MDTFMAELSSSNGDGVVHKSLNYLLFYWDMVLHACRSSTWEVEAVGKELKASLGCIDPVSNKTRKKG